MDLSAPRVRKPTLKRLGPSSQVALNDLFSVAVLIFMDPPGSHFARCRAFVHAAYNFASGGAIVLLGFAENDPSHTWYLTRRPRARSYVPAIVWDHQGAAPYFSPTGVAIDL